MNGRTPDDERRAGREVEKYLYLDKLIKSHNDKFDRENFPQDKVYKELIISLLKLDLSIVKNIFSNFGVNFDVIKTDTKTYQESFMVAVNAIYTFGHYDLFLEKTEELVARAESEGPLITKLATYLKDVCLNYMNGSSLEGVASNLGYDRGDLTGTDSNKRLQLFEMVRNNNMFIELANQVVIDFSQNVIRGRGLVMVRSPRAIEFSNKFAEIGFQLDSEGFIIKN